MSNRDVPPKETTKIIFVKTDHWIDLIVARKEFLCRVMGFIQKKLAESGKEIYYSDAGCKTHQIKWWSCGDFSFLADLGQTTMGGNTIEVFLNRDSKRKEYAERENSAICQTVLKVFWNPSQLDIDDCEVLVFNDEPDFALWPKLLMRLIIKSERLAVPSFTMILKEASRLGIKLE